MADTAPSSRILRRYLSELRKTLRKWQHMLQPSGDRISKIAVLDMLAHNWWLGFTSFGGPSVHFQIFRRLYVEKYQWLDESQYVELFALCQALSGPGSTKMHLAINMLHYDLLNGVLAFLIWSLPMALAAFGLALGVHNIGAQLPDPVYALLSGLNSATVGIIALAAIQLSAKAITDRLTRVLVFLGAAAGMLYNALWYFPVIMVAGGLATVVIDLRLFQRTWKAMWMSKPEDDRVTEEHELATPVAADSTSQIHATNAGSSHKAVPSADQTAIPLDPATPAPAAVRTSWKVGTAIIAAFFVSFIVIMVCRGTIRGTTRGFDLFANLYLAGTIIFGGGPVVIPLLREYIVAPGWVSPRDFLLGLAITQAFPGPNFNFAVYLGTLAVADTSIPPVVGAMIGFVGIFTPGLWLLVGTTKIWATVRKVHAVRAALRGIHAAAVGLVFTAVYRLFQIGYLDAEAQGGSSLSRDGWWVVIISAACYGGMHFHLSPPLAIVLGAIMGLIWYGVTK
ncbi:hypothetical protein B0A48_00212 [Cryoendolithus antarcticus]|uniref:Chromate ion transporter n=1 Tax=Cryoendolithus antarcticus TaxID=1507870 RepID=A0A1V8TTY2_9PEZI|nr:hypothetical protein B0A48_00212 [Cryoendolithus antarcticus]